ncbi:MAG: hypothetical protein ACTFAK_12465 [Candidatus Electronema sp. VV]
MSFRRWSSSSSVFPAATSRRCSDQPPHGFDKDDSLAFEFNFTGFLPRHIMPNFIVGRHDEIKGELVWQNGVVLSKQDSSAEALLQVDYHDRVLSLWVRGNKANDYFKIIYDDLKRILNLMPELRFDEKVIVPEESRIEDGQFLHLPDEPIKADFRQLLAMEDKGRTEYDCEYGTFDLAKILQIMPKEARLTVSRQEKLAETINFNFNPSPDQKAVDKLPEQPQGWIAKILASFFKGRFRRAAMTILASLLGMNALSALEGNIHLSGLADKPVAILFKLGFGDSPWLNVALVALAGLLFVLDYKENKNR